MRNHNYLRVSSAISTTPIYKADNKVQAQGYQLQGLIAETRDFFLYWKISGIKPGIFLEY